MCYRRSMFSVLNTALTTYLNNISCMVVVPVVPQIPENDFIVISLVLRFKSYHFQSSSSPVPALPPPGIFLARPYFS